MQLNPAFTSLGVGGATAGLAFPMDMTAGRVSGSSGERDFLQGVFARLHLSDF